MGIQGSGGEFFWIGNVYLPPVTNLKTRGIEEEVARHAIEDIIGAIPTHSRSIMCGDWNTRVGNLHPKIGETDILRCSLDTTVGTRAPWVIDTCEQKNWYILNGIQPSPPAIYTYEKGDKKSCIDYILSTDPTHYVEYDLNTLGNLSDHVMLMTKI